jgi:hypothetical protein
MSGTHRSDMQERFEQSRFYFRGESASDRAVSWEVWKTAWQAALSTEPLGVEQAVKLWHMNTVAHERESAFEWFASGILAAEAAHGITRDVSPNTSSTNTPK